MSNEALVSISGFVASEPSRKTVRGGLQVLSMRVGWTPRRRDRVTGEWADGKTSFVSVNCWRKLAENGATCLRKGDPVVVHGRLMVQPFDGKDGVRRTDVTVEASVVGHDLNRGVAHFQKTWPPAGRTAVQAAGESATGGNGDRFATADQDESAALAALADGGLAPGSADSTGPVGPAEADGTAAFAEPAEPDDDMFDEDRVADLAKESEGAAAPF